MRKTLATIAFFAATTAAQAGGWQVHSHRDPMTDRVVKWAEVQAKASQSAWLEIRCVRGPQLLARFGVRMTPGRLGFVYRVDDRPAVPRHGPILSDMERLYIGDHEVAALAGAKRFRLQIRPVGGSLFFDFDVAGADAAIRRLDCSRSR